MASPVTAVILQADAGSTDATVAALRQQSVAPDEIVVGELPPTSAADGRWLWLVESGVRPDRGALKELLDAAEAKPGQRYALLASRVISPEGELDFSAVPVPLVHDSTRVLHGLERHLLPLRAARSGCLLVSAEVLREARVSTSAGIIDRDLEWTARVLRRELGVLVPRSIAVRVDGHHRRRRHAVILSRIRLVARLEQRERLWFAAHLFERMLDARARDAN